VAVTDVALTLGITVALALVLSGRLEWAGVAVGLAASAKYPGRWRSWRSSRVLDVADRYPREARFYADLDDEARRVLVVRPGDCLTGSWVSLYRL
jgi:hypothetical protein